MVFGLTRKTIEVLLEVAYERLRGQYGFYASLVGAEFESSPQTQDPKELLEQVRSLGVAFEVKKNG